MAALNGFIFMGRALKVEMSNYQGAVATTYQDQAAAAAPVRKEEDDLLDAMRVPTSFTSRDGKAEDAVELRQEQRHDADPACTVCGEVGHFAQGCPLMMAVPNKWATGGPAVEDRWAGGD